MSVQYFIYTCVYIHLQALAHTISLTQTCILHYAGTSGNADIAGRRNRRFDVTLSVYAITRDGSIGSVSRDIPSLGKHSSLFVMLYCNPLSQMGHTVESI